MGVEDSKPSCRSSILPTGTMIKIDDMFAETIYTLLCEHVQALSSGRTVFVYGLVDNAVKGKEFDIPIISSLVVDMRFCCNFEDKLLVYVAIPDYLSMSLDPLELSKIMSCNSGLLSLLKMVGS